MKKFAVIDVETPSRKNDRISSIAIVLMDECEIVDEFHALVNPETDFDLINTKLTGISAATVKNAPVFSDLWPKISSMLEGRILVAHGAAFDLSVLKKTCHAYGLLLPSEQYYCTLALSKQFFPELTRYRLNDLCSEFGLMLEHHHAESDCLACAQILQRMLRLGLVLPEPSGREQEQTHERSFSQRNGLSETSKELNELLSLLQTMTDDGQVSIDEFSQLCYWISSHEHLSGEFPFDRIMEALSDILKDGIVSSEELDELCDVIDEVIDPVSHADSTTDISLSGKQVCLSGDFDHGSKKEIKALLESKGAIIRNTVVKKLDYLIVGNQGNAAWVSGNYGSKIKKAMELQNAGEKVQIIREDELFEALNQMPDKPVTFSATEEEIYTLLLPTITQALDQNFLTTDVLRVENGKQYSSVFIRKDLVCRICSRGKAATLAIKLKDEKQIPHDVRFERKNGEEDSVWLYLDTPEIFEQVKALVSDAVHTVIKNIPYDFDCCSRYEQCSNAKRCIHPDPEFALWCSYRQKLAQGIIFYGKNKNIK